MDCEKNARCPSSRATHQSHTSLREPPTFGTHPTLTSQVLLLLQYYHLRVIARKDGVFLHLARAKAAAARSTSSPDKKPKSSSRCIIDARSTWTAILPCGKRGDRIFAASVILPTLFEDQEQGRDKCTRERCTRFILSVRLQNYPPVVQDQLFLSAVNFYFLEHVGPLLMQNPPSFCFCVSKVHRHTARHSGGNNDDKC